MAVEFISWLIPAKVRDQTGIELETPGSAVRHISAVRHVPWPYLLTWDIKQQNKQTKSISLATCAHILLANYVCISLVNWAPILLTKYANAISWTTGPKSKFHRNGPHVALYLNWSEGSAWLNNMATRAKNRNILYTISLAISYVLHLYVLIFVQYQTISIAMTRTGS